MPTTNRGPNDPLPFIRPHFGQGHGSGFPIGLLEREREGGLGRLLFPSLKHDGEEKMLRDLRGTLDAVAKRAGFPDGSIRFQQLRHTYTSARIQTCDRGRPVALYTVARELGHTSTDQIEDRYGHLHDRVEEGAPEVVEYRIDAHRERLGERLTALERLVEVEAAQAP